jgi:hypothetical protein
VASAALFSSRIRCGSRSVPQRLDRRRAVARARTPALFREWSRRGRGQARSREATARTSTLGFQRPSPRVRNPYARNVDLPLASIHGLAVRGHKPGANQIGQHTNVDPMREQRCPGAVLQACDCKQFESAALVRVDFRSIEHALGL